MKSREAACERIYIYIYLYIYIYIYIYIYWHDSFIFDRINLQTQSRKHVLPWERTHCMTRLYVHTYMCTYVHASYVTEEEICRRSHERTCCHGNIQAGEDPQDAFSCRSFFAKEPLMIGLFCEKWPVKIRHAMGLRLPVLISWLIYMYILICVHMCILDM